MTRSYAQVLLSEQVLSALAHAMNRHARGERQKKFLFTKSDTPHHEYLKSYMIYHHESESFGFSFILGEDTLQRRFS
jgi:urease accessory protein UreE